MGEIRKHKSPRNFWALLAPGPPFTNYPLYSSLMGSTFTSICYYLQFSFSHFSSFPQLFGSFCPILLMENPTDIYIKLEEFVFYYSHIKRTACFSRRISCFSLEVGLYDLFGSSTSMILSICTGFLLPKPLLNKVPMHHTAFLLNTCENCMI